MALDICPNKTGLPRDLAEARRMKCAYTQGFYDAILYTLGFLIVCTGITIAILWAISLR